MKIILCLLNYIPSTVVKVSLLKYLNLDNTQWRIFNLLRGRVSRSVMSFFVQGTKCYLTAKYSCFSLETITTTTACIICILIRKYNNFIVEYII